MIRTVALLGLVASASSAFLGLGEHDLWTPDIRVKFSTNVLTWTKTSFYPIALSSIEAEEKGWKIVERPTRNCTSGYDKLKMWVNPENLMVSIIVDEEGRTIGLQIAFIADGLEPCYDMVEQGFTKWYYTDDAGDTTELWTACLFFGSEDEETRSTSYNDTQVLQGDYVIADGSNCEPIKMATDHKKVDSSWIKEACIPFMGLHYYNNMTKDLSCADPITKWFPLYDPDTSQMMGVGFMIFVKKAIDGFERPTRSDVEMIVPTAPECMLELVDSCGVSTLHIYFIDKPYIYLC